MKEARFHPEIPADLRSSGLPVHDFWDVNPQLGPESLEGVPSRHMARLFQRLMPYYGSNDYGDFHPAAKIVEQMGMPVNGIPDPEDALWDQGDVNAFRLEDFLFEPYANQVAKEQSNFVYDAKQPYAQPSPEPDFYADYGPENDVISKDGELMWDSEGYNALDNVKNTALPIVRTAGSMALPMLFNMLMRGGR